MAEPKSFFDYKPRATTSGPLQFSHTWTLWFTHGQSDTLDYVADCKSIASFRNSDDFWACYSHLQRPHDLPPSDIHLFRDGIRPIWEVSVDYIEQQASYGQ
eukprot:m.27175 g.27175  ORF g.27175 m.27175 type:complete len:101 (+) comp8903_c0_seq2:503-805(+)